MAFETGIFTDIDDADSIADPMVMVRASAIQLPMNKARIWEDAAVHEDPESNRKFEIYSRSETQRNGELSGAIDDVVTTITVASTAGLIKGLVLQIEDEVVVIDTVPNDTTFTVRKRGTAGTTAAAHADATPFTVLGTAIDDQDLKNMESVSEITTVYTNYMQTTAETVDYTRGGRLDPRKGLSDTMVATLEEEALLRVAKGIATSAVRGKKQEKTANEPWMTAGILQQLSDNSDGRIVLTYDAAGVLTEDKLRAALRIVTERGVPTDIYVSSANKDVINTFLASSAATKLTINADKSDTQAGYYVDTYNYEGVILNVKIDLDMPNDQIAIMNMNKVYKGWKRGDELQLEEQTTLSSREKRAAYNGSYFIAVEDVGYDHILITGITQA